MPSLSWHKHGSDYAFSQAWGSFILESSENECCAQGGDVIRSIRSETNAKVKVEDIVPGQTERAITISAADKSGAPSCPTQDALQKLLQRVVEIEGPGGVVAIAPTVRVCILAEICMLHAQPLRCGMQPAWIASHAAYAVHAVLLTLCRSQPPSSWIVPLLHTLWAKGVRASSTLQRRARLQSQH